MVQKLAFYGFFILLPLPKAPDVDYNVNILIEVIIMKYVKPLICVILCLLCITLCCCSEKSESLTADYTRSGAVPVYDFFSGEEITPENYAKFTPAYMDFAAELLVASSEDESVVLSPLSLYTALSMTSNGASGKTLKELESLLGDDLKTADINTYIHYLNSRVQALNNDNGYVKTANSLWLRDSYSVKAQFLQSIVNYFDAEVFRTDLAGDGSEKINDWISNNTDGKIKELISPLDQDTAMVLVNALLFSDNWLTPYPESAVTEGTFNGTKGKEPATFMQSNEMFISSVDAKGIVKNYENTPCRFVAILPNENIGIDEYIGSLSGSKLETILGSASGVNRCEAKLPQFKLRTNKNLNDTVKAMGAELMFTSEADFGNLTMTDGLYVSDVLQESYIEINTEGTKAGSASAVVMKDIAAAPQEFEGLVFDRPFVFMIVENESNLPLFIGAVKALG